MKLLITFPILFCFSIVCNAQPYFPPKTGNEWATITPQEAGWNTSQIEPLLQWLDEKNTKAFIVLKDGKIAIEQYYGDFTEDSLWYWASAGKSLAAFLVGIAQQEGLLDIHDKTSDYLGKGWTSAPQEKENLITIWHQITMTTGLDDGLTPTSDIPDPDNCLEPACLQYLTDPGTRWAYHNAPYRLVQDVVAAAAGQTFQQFTNQRIKQKIGMNTGFWLNYVFWSRPRDMARFGLLALNKGVWDGEAVLSDTVYYNEMVHTSQNLNKSYGYLWWLNGKEAFMLPQSQVVFPSDLLPSAPDEVFMALGKNDQKIYIYPSENIVVVRMGDSAEGRLALSAFDDELWARLAQVFGTTTNAPNVPLLQDQIRIYPNPGHDRIQLEKPAHIELLQVTIFDFLGKKVKSWNQEKSSYDVQDVSAGIYLIQLKTDQGTEILKWVKR